MYSEFEPTDKKTLDILDKIRGDHRKIKSLIEDSFEDDDDEFIKTSEILKKLFLNHKKIKEEKLYLHQDKKMSKSGSKELIDDLNLYTTTK